MEIGYEEVVELLLDKGADVNLPNTKGETPLILAMKHYYIPNIVKLLLDKGAADPNISNRKKETPLILAINYNTAKIVKLLLDKGANIYIPNSEGETPLFLTFKNGNHEKIDLMLNRAISLGDFDLNSSDKDGNTLLHIAGRNNDIATFLKLIENGADMNVANNEGKTPLQYTNKPIRSELIQLLDNNADVNLPNIKGKTPLIYAINKCNHRLVKILLDKGADVNIPNSKGVTPLFIAAKRGNFKIVQLLINKSGALVNALDKDGNTLLHIAGRNNHIRLVFKLLENGADVNIANNKGKTPLQYMDPIYSQLFGNEHHVYELREYKGYQVPITIIPRGTLLFRAGGQPEGDFCGIPDGNRFCLNKNFEVFFYPYPGYWGGSFNIFVVEETLKIVNLIYPSYLSRDDTYNEDYDFLTSCVTAEPIFCGNLSGRWEEPCLSKEFLEANPDINGLIAIHDDDIDRMHIPGYEFLNNYSLFYQDIRGSKGIPEIILYPKQQRMLEEQNWSLEECSDTKNPNNYSYLLDGGRSYSVNDSIMELLLSPKGYKIKRDPGEIKHPFTQLKFDKMHVTIYNPLKMFVVWEYLPEEYKKDCVPLILDAKSKLSQFQRDINKLNKGLYETLFTTYKKYSTRGGKTKTKRKNKKTRK